MTNPNDFAMPSPSDLHGLQFRGFTKREHIAIELMQGMLANGSLNYGMDFEAISRKAVTATDELIKALNESIASDGDAKLIAESKRLFECVNRLLPHARLIITSNHADYKFVQSVINELK